MKIFIVISTLFLAVTTVTTGQTYNLNISKGTMQWTGKAAFNAYTLSGTLAPAQGKLSVLDDKITQTTIIIDMKSLEAENKDLKKHLRGKDFFEVKKYTTAKFVLTESINLTANNAIAKGKLTIKGKTVNQSFPVAIKKVGNTYEVKGQLTVDRTKFGIYYNSPNYFKNLKQNAIADDFVLEIDLVFE